jgi:hypothetical protein
VNFTILRILFYFNEKFEFLHLVLSSCVLDLSNRFVTEFCFSLRALASAPVRSGRSQLLELAFFPVHFPPGGSFSV